MTFYECEWYAEAIALSHKQIKMALEEAKYELAKKAASSYAGADPDLAVESVTVVFEKQNFEVLHPAAWLKVFRFSLARYADRYGRSALATVTMRYIRGYTATGVYTRQGISRRLFNERRQRFLSLMAAYAVANGLLVLD